MSQRLKRVSTGAVPAPAPSSTTTTTTTGELEDATMQDAQVCLLHL